MKTEKLYYADSHLTEFFARVLRCKALEDGRYAAVLDRTAFFPEGGGQYADTGRIGDAAVLDVQETEGKIIHYLASAVAEDTEVHCVLDREQRLRRMQNHSGEHILSGLVHAAYGYDNVGFHMGETCMTIDFSGELAWEQILVLERRANGIVRSNIPVKTYFPAPEELPQLTYRSKLDLTEDVRIVEIEGVDRCACCAPHVSCTGEIGVIKVLSCERHRGGVRLEVVCGMDALDNFNARQQSVTEISNLLSAKRTDVSAAVERLRDERDELKFLLAATERSLVEAFAAAAPQTEKNLLYINGKAVTAGDEEAPFEAPAETGILKSEISQRELVNLLMPQCGGMAAVFIGSDEKGYRYVIGSAKTDLRAKAREINAAISGRGGGRKEMIMGSCTAPASVIRKYFFEGSESSR